MSINKSDLKNCEEALEQMIFRCRRNLSLLDERISQADDPEGAGKEKQFVAEKLERYEKTCRIIHAALEE